MLRWRCCHTRHCRLLPCHTLLRRRLPAVAYHYDLRYAADALRLLDKRYADADATPLRRCHAAAADTPHAASALTPRLHMAPRRYARMLRAMLAPPDFRCLRAVTPTFHAAMPPRYDADYALMPPLLIYFPADAAPYAKRAAADARFLLRAAILRRAIAATRYCYASPLRQRATR